MKHILIVDDVSTNLKLVAAVLKGQYDVSTARSGQQALEALSVSPKTDLILLDISMPDMDGYETLKQIQANALWKDIPVIFLTADTDTESEKKGLEMGVRDYIRKPFDPMEMKSRIEKFLQ